MAMVWEDRNSQGIPTDRTLNSEHAHDRLREHKNIDFDIDD